MPPDVQTYVLMSGDGRWWWDGSAWQPTTSPSIRKVPSLVMPHGLAMMFLRISLYGLITGLVVYSFLAQNLGQMQTQNSQLVAQTVSEQHRISDLQAQVSEMQATIDDLRSRWIGEPALWQASGLPSDTVVQYFDVTGTTQAELIQALKDANLCGNHKCLVDPAVPTGYALALETEGNAVPNAAYCYSPHTISYSWSQHTILLPRWSPKPGTVKIELVQRWNALEAVLLTHEIGHVIVANNYLASLNVQSQQLSSCQQLIAFWGNPQIWDGLDQAQNAYHAKLRADCRPEVGCIPYGWMGW